MVKGLEELHRRFQAVPQIVRNEVVKELEKAASELVREMQSLAPKGTTRKLVNSIGWTWGDAPKGSLTIGKVANREYGKLSITIYAGGDEAFYARFQEFGTRNMPANPFFYPVYRSNKSRIKGRLSRAVTRAVKKS